MSPERALFERLESQLPLVGLAWDGPSGHRSEAAVLVALTAESSPRVILGRRAMHLRMHPGEIAFPGGKREVGDETPWVTALREAHEEIGLEAGLVHRLGEFAPLVTRTGFEVHPCVGKVPSCPEMVVDSGEFDSVFLLPLEVFADRDIFRLESMSDGKRTRMVPHYQVGSDSIWGVTAAVLAQLANVAYDAGLELQRNWNTEP
jgi:8-oxo-dGTP pyrophosphatase MutT (NUDIX family)